MKLFLSIVALSLVAGPATGCKKKEDSASLATYTTRGKIVKLAASGATDITLNHEAIPDFVGRNGEVSGMMSMSMRFGLDKGLSTAAVATGDIVEFTFNVDWGREPAIEVTALRKLTADTELKLGGGP